MYGSLKSWINLPAQLKPFLKRDGAGTKIYGDTVDILCYAEGKVQVVTDNAGTEVVSTSQLYVDGSITISVLDCVIFEGIEKSIKNITTFYRDGKPDIKVVYL
jgi:hypothetical protein